VASTWSARKALQSPNLCNPAIRRPRTGSETAGHDGRSVMSGSGNEVLAVGLGLAALIGAASVPVILWAARRGLPWGICERLERGKTVRVRTGYALGGAWNPARPLGRQTGLERCLGRPHIG